MATSDFKRGQPEGVAGGNVGGAFGLWLNKRELLALEIPLRHEITPQNTGWRLEFTEAGKVTARHTQGARGIDVQPGDFMISSGDDMYVAIHAPAGRPTDEPKGEPTDEPAPKGEPRGKPTDAPTDQPRGNPADAPTGEATVVKDPPKEY